MYFATGASNSATPVSANDAQVVLSGKIEDLQSISISRHAYVESWPYFEQFVGQLNNEAYVLYEKESATSILSKSS